MNVTGTFGSAWQRTTRVLLRPFDLGTWFSFGVIFFLQSLLEGSGNYSFRLPSSSKRGGGSSSGFDLKELLDEARTWLSANMSIVIGVGVTVAILGVALGVLFMWLGTRGQMMAIRSVMTGRAAIGEHWRETRTAAWSLFKLQIVISLVAFAIGGPLVVFGLYRFVDLVDAGITDFGPLGIAFIPFAVVGGVLAFVVLVVQAMIRNFVAPVMLRFDLGPGAAWSRFRSAASGSFGSIALFFLIRVALGVGVSILALIVTLCTCCIGALPVLQQTLMAPWLFFERAYGLCAIESLGPEMKMLDELDYYPSPPPPPGGFGPPGPPLSQVPWPQ